MMTEKQSRVTGTLPVSEQFLSIQGEGITAGIPSYFLRLKTCNLMCGGKGTEKDGQLHNGATWRCDTIEVWMKGENKHYAVIVDDFGGDEFLRNIRAGTHHLVITGGEPMLHQEAILDFLLWLENRKKNSFGFHSVFLEVETNGTLMPSRGFIEQVNQFNISPKLSNSGISLGKRQRSDVISFFSKLAFHCKVQFKFVVASDKDFMEVIKEWVNVFDIDKRTVVMMPAADNEADLKRVSEAMAPLCYLYGYRFSHRMHVAIWNKKTGV